MDRKVDAEVERRLGVLRSLADAPSRSGDEGPGADPALLVEQPPTTNPTPGELRFTPADEARNVSERLALATAMPTEGVRVLTLQDALRQAQLTSTEHLTAEEEYIQQAISLLIERHLWSPRFFADTTADVQAAGNDGSYDSVVRVLNRLRATQRLPWGGEVEARAVWNATEELRNEVTGQYQQVSEVVLAANIPLLRGAGSIAREDLIQSERNLVYAARDYEDSRRELLVAISRDYFALLQQRANIENQQKQLDALRRREVEADALYRAGRRRQFDLLILRNEVLSAEASLQSLRDAHVLALDRFKVRLGLPVTEAIAVAGDVLELPEPNTTAEEATSAALEFRLDLQNRRDRLDDAKRAVRNARNQLLPDLNLTGSAGLRTDPDAREGGFVYEPDDAVFDAGVTLGWPLDREIERLRLRSSIIDLQQTARNLDVFRDTVVLDVRSRWRQIDLQRYNLQLAEEAVRINERRQLEQVIRRSEVTSQELADTENELLRARNAYAQALTNLRNVVLDFLLATGQLRVARDGTLYPLPGLVPSEEPALPVEPGAAPAPDTPLEQPPPNDPR